MTDFISLCMPHDSKIPCAPCRQQSFVDTNTYASAGCHCSACTLITTYNFLSKTVHTLRCLPECQRPVLVPFSLKADHAGFCRPIRKARPCFLHTLLGWDTPAGWDRCISMAHLQVCHHSDGLKDLSRAPATCKQQPGKMTSHHITACTWNFNSVLTSAAALHICAQLEQINIG